MPTTDDKIEKFTSHMLKALRALTSAQLDLVNAQRYSNATTEDDRTWELLWGNLRSVISLGSVIRASVMNRGAPEATEVETLTSAALPAPLIPKESEEFRPLREAVDDAMRCAEQMSRSTADAFEQLLYAGHGESDCAQTVSMVRLYGRAAQSLLETVQSELEPAGTAVTN